MLINLSAILDNYPPKQAKISLLFTSFTQFAFIMLQSTETLPLLQVSPLPEDWKSLCLDRGDLAP